LAVPLLLVGSGVLAAVLGQRGSSDQRIAVLDETRSIGAAVVESLNEAGYRAELAPREASDPGLLNQRVLDRDIGGYLILDDRTLERGYMVYRGDERPSALRRIVLQQAVVAAAVEARYGADADAATELFRGGSLEIELMDPVAPNNREVGMLYAIVGSTILYVALLVYGIWLLRAVIEEKTNRTVEVMLSAIRPWQMMLGKILGVGAVGLTQISIWVAILIGAASLGAPALLASRPEFASIEGITDLAPGLKVVALFVVFFVLGFLLFASLYAAAGAMCSTDQEAQQVSQPVNLLIIAPFIVLMSVFESGLEASWMTGLSFVPFFSPILMFARAASGVAPAWQVALSFVLMALTTVAIAWMAGRIYKVGILMQGKRPTLPELIRWVRQG